MSEPIILEQSESKEQEENSRHSSTQNTISRTSIGCTKCTRKYFRVQRKDRSKEKILSMVKLLKFVKINKTSDLVRTGISTVARKHQCCDGEYQYRGQTAALWSVNVSIPTGGYQHCGQ
ncbi:hypothetical protein Avbf_15754 [Armadillidium vulgare]|nr:hypothetical protein Avbf_15754 [Armadillidium vulgare]